MTDVFSEKLAAWRDYTETPWARIRYGVVGEVLRRQTTHLGERLRVLDVGGGDGMDALPLALAGHDVRLAFDGASGIEAARSYLPHVVISDIGLPGAFDGYGVARALRAATEHAGVRLIAVSGYANADARRRSRDAGFDAHLSKPPDLAALEQVLATVRRD